MGRWYAGLGTKHVRRNSHAYGLLHAILATAVSDGILTSNPATLKGVMNPPAKRAAEILDVDDIGKLANAITPERRRAVVLVSAWCGLRWGEVIELRRKGHRAGLLDNHGGPRCDSPQRLPHRHAQEWQG